MNKKILRLSEIFQLETFDHAAFIGDEQVSQDICNFILSLACFYNDYKDSLMALVYLEKMRPNHSHEGETIELGEYSGVQLHIIRIQFAQIHELFDLLKRNEKVINKPFFQSLIKQLDKEARQHWEMLTIISQGKDCSKKVAKPFLMIRNKIAFHYDSKEIFKGYKKYFCNAEVQKQAYISRGSTLKQERYYFADAAAQNYFYSLYDGMDEKEIHDTATKTMESVAPALSQIIKRFIQKRGYSWRAVE